MFFAEGSETSLPRLSTALPFVRTLPIVDYLLPIADREPLLWIVRTQQTALPAYRASEAASLQPGDRLLLYTTRGCFRNPTRDRGRVIAIASVSERPRVRQPPVNFRGRDFTVGLRFRIERLAPMREGVELAPLVRQLATFPDPRSWSVRLRRALVPLVADDGDFLVRALEEVAAEYPQALNTYKLP
jgi:hypothetical protein